MRFPFHIVNRLGASVRMSPKYRFARHWSPHCSSLRRCSSFVLGLQILHFFALVSTGTANQRSTRFRTCLHRMSWTTPVPTRTQGGMVPRCTLNRDRKDRAPVNTSPACAGHGINPNPYQNATFFCSKERWRRGCVRKWCTQHSGNPKYLPNARVTTCLCSWPWVDLRQARRARARALIWVFDCV